MVEAEGEVAKAEGAAAELLELDVEGSLSRQNDSATPPDKPFDLVAKLVVVFSIVTTVTMVKTVFIRISMTFRLYSHQSRLR